MFLCVCFNSEMMIILFAIQVNCQQSVHYVRQSTEASFSPCPTIHWPSDLDFPPAWCPYWHACCANSFESRNRIVFHVLLQPHNSFNHRFGHVPTHSVIHPTHAVYVALKLSEGLFDEICIFEYLILKLINRRPTAQLLAKRNAEGHFSWLSSGESLPPI